IEHKVRKQYRLDSQDKANLCIFAAAMFSRVDPQSRVHVNFLQEIHDKVKRMEETHNTEPPTSLELATILENARPKFVGRLLQMLAKLYYGPSFRELSGDCQASEPTFSIYPWGYSCKDLSVKLFVSHYCYGPHGG